MTVRRFYRLRAACQFNTMVTGEAVGDAPSLIVFIRNRPRRSSFGTGSAHDDDVQSGQIGPAEDARRMRSLDERVAYVEGRMEDQTSLIADIRGEVRDLRVEMRDVRAEMRDLRTEVRADIRELRLEMNLRFDRMDQKFTWLVGMFVALLLGLLGVAVQVARLQPS